MAQTHYNLEQNVGFYLRSAQRLFRFDKEDDYNLFEEIDYAVQEQRDAQTWNEKPLVPPAQIAALQKEIDAARERGKEVYAQRFYQTQNRFEDTARRKDPALIPVLSEQRMHLDFIADRYAFFFENEDVNKEQSLWNVLLGRKSLAQYVQEQEERMRLIDPLMRISSHVGTYVMTALFPTYQSGGGPFPGYTTVRTEKSMREEIAYLGRECKLSHFIEGELWAKVMDETVRKPTTENIDIYHKLTAHIFDLPYSVRQLQQLTTKTHASSDRVRKKSSSREEESGEQERREQRQAHAYRRDREREDNPYLI